MDEMEQGALDTERPGDVLRQARETQNLSLQDVATRTRVPLRQLTLIEANDYAALPGVPYAIGFARAYARAIGVDEVVIAAGVRRELASAGAVPAPRYEMFEPHDPARVPSRLLAWTAAVIALLLAIGYGVWRSQMFTPPSDEQIAAQTAPAARPVAGTAASRPAAPPAQGPVVLTATDQVWLRIYDGTGERLFEKQMAKGETYTVPADANNPMILTGRPNAVAVTVGGRAVAPLGAPERTISDVPISAAALLARPAANVPAAPDPAAVAPASGAVVPAQE